MKNNNKVIPIFFSVDDNYVPYLAVALKSMISNASKEYTYKVIVLHQGVSESNINRVKQLQNDIFTIDFVPMKDSFSCITDRMSNRLRADYFTLTIYFRLFIPAMFPEYDKGIYLDSDIVVPGDISKLYEIDIEDKLIGASVDYSIQNIPEFAEYTEKGIGVVVSEYINSGVLLMNLKKLREVSIDTRFLELLNTYHFDSIAPDQDYLNAMCYGKVKYLSGNWDAMPEENTNPLDDPKLIHYNLFAKPWCYDNIQYEDYFWKYAKDSGYIDEIKEFKKNYSDTQKQSDKECTERMVKRALEIAQQKENFRTVFASGKERRL